MGRVSHWGVLSLLLTAACGGETSGGGSSLDACGPAGACGGDLSGTWTVQALCSGMSGTPTESSLPAECQDGYRRAYSSTAYTPVGLTISFTGGSYAFSGNLTSTLTWPMTDSCFRALSSGVGLSPSQCTQWGDRSQASLDPNYNAQCSYIGGVCTCTFKQTSSPSGGTYTTSGTTITWDSGVASPYCVSGSTAMVDDTETLGNGEIIGRLKLRR